MNIKGKITNLSVATENDVGGTMMTIKTAIIHDKLGFTPFTIL